MNFSNQLSRYGAVKVTTCTPGQRLLMVYDALFRFLREAMAAIASGDRTRAAERMNRSHAIVNQLLLGLDRRVSPDLCDKLEPLYAFCMQEILAANVALDGARLGEVLGVLSPLREAWRLAVAEADADEAAGALKKTG